METPVVRPDTINKLRFATDGALAMLAGMQIDLFTPLKDGPLTTKEIASATGTKAERLRLLLWSLVAAGLLTEKEGWFANTDEANHFLVKGLSSYMGNMHASLASQWGLRLKSGDSLRKGEPQAKIYFSNSPSEDLEEFLRRINTSSVAATRSLLARYDFSSIKAIADVGCGGAGVALTMTQACPRLEATAIDLPQITPITQKIVNEEGAADRVKVLSANVLSGPLPGSYDTAILRALIQVLAPEDARRAIKNVGAAIKSGGKIYIVGQILDDSRTSPPEAVGFNLTFISTFDAGESYTESEHRKWLGEAGFVDIERANVPLAGGLGLMTARKPE